MRHRWISPQFITTNRIDRVARSTARSARWAPGSSRRSASRRRPPTWSGSTDRRGCASPRSAAARPASARGTSTPPPTTSTSTASGPTASSTAARSAPCRAQYSAGIIALRPSGTGTIQGYSGLDDIRDRYDEWIIDAHLPDPGTADPAGRGRLHGQRLGPDEAPRLRRPPRDARRRRDAPCTSMRADPVTTTEPCDGCSSTHLLGPQRFLTTAGAVVRSLDVEGPVATITAGWEERESDDGELDAVMDGRSAEPAPVRPHDGRPRT